MKKFTVVGIFIFISYALGACGPSEQHKATIARDCLDRVCKGDIDPRKDRINEVLIKKNGQFFIGPTEYWGEGRWEDSTGPEKPQCLKVGKLLKRV